MAFFRPASRPLPTTAMMMVCGIRSESAGAISVRRRWRLGWLAPLPVLLAPAVVWASFTILNYPTVNTLSTGSVTLSGPSSVAIDSRGNVYIADSGHNQVVELTAAGAATVVSFPGLSPVLGSAGAVAVDGSGNLYVADSANARVVELSAGAASVVDTASLLTTPSGLAFDAAGDLYIADASHNYIVKVPAGGGTAAVLGITGLGTPLSQPYGLAFDIPGNLYIADSANNRIVEVTAGLAGSPLTITGETLNTPQGVAVDGFGNVYIADNNNSRVVTVAPGGSGAVLDAPLFGVYASPTPLTVLHPKGIAIDGSGILYIADTNDNRIVQAMPSSAAFGHVALGASSGTTLTVSFLLGGFTTIGSAQAYTLGTSSLDFTVVAGSGTTCVTGFNGSGSDVACTVQVAFLPVAAGLRRGALVVYNNSTPPAPIITIPLYGTGDAPLAALSPGTASVVSTAPLPMASPFQVAFDAVGNMYVANYGSVAGNVVKVPAGGGSATVVSIGEFTLAGAIGVALDGAGNLYIADHDNNRILKVTTAGGTTQLSISGLSTGLFLPAAIAMDGAGNLYISDYGNGRIVKVTPSGAGSVLATGSFTFPAVSVLGVTVDAAGTVYIPDASGNRVVKVTASGAASLVIPAGITPALSSPQGVAVDAFGNLYIADSGNRRIVEITTAGVASVVQMPGQPIVSDYGVTVDVSGNVFIPDFTANRILKVNVAAASLAFPSTPVGQASTAQTATVTNLGDIPLAFSTSPSYTANFSQPTGATGQCLIGTSVTPGAVCDVSVQFTPQSVGSLSAGIVLANDNLNVSGSTQTVSVSGTGSTPPADTTAVSVSASPTSASIGQPVIITATLSDTTSGHTSTIPTGGVTFVDTVGSTSVSLNGGSAVISIAGVATLTATLSGAGTHTLTANYVGVSGSFLASSNTTTLTVSKDSGIIAGPISQPFQVPIGQAGAVPITVTGPYSVVALPTGTLTFTVLNSSNTSVASGTVNLTAGTTNSTASVPLPSTLATGTYTITVTYSGDSNYAGGTITVTVAVGKSTPVVTLTSSAATVLLKSSVTFTATVSSSAATPTGSVVFLDGGTSLGSATLTAGVATFTTSILAAGAHTITAQYAGDSNYSSLTSAALTETIQDFSLNVASSGTMSATVQPGGTATYALVFGPTTGTTFPAAVTLTVTGGPTGAILTISPKTLAAGAGPTNVTLTVQLPKQSASNPGGDTSPKFPIFYPSSLTLGILFLPFAGRLRRSAFKHRDISAVLLLALLSASLLALTGCGAKDTGFLGTPTTTYPLTVTATSGNLSHSTTLSLTVQ